MSEREEGIPKLEAKRADAVPGHSELELSASGFVGMLSRRAGRTEPDPLGSPPPVVAGNRAATSLPKPKPVANQRPASAGTEAAGLKSAGTKAHPAWIGALVPELYMLGLLLVIVGIWAGLGLMRPAVMPDFGMAEGRHRMIAVGLLALIPLGGGIVLGTHRWQGRLKKK